MKSAVMVALNSMRRNKRSCLVTLLAIILSVSLIVFNFVFWVSLADFNTNYYYKEFADRRVAAGIEVVPEEIMSEVTSKFTYIRETALFMLFASTGVAVGAVSIGSALMINGNEKARTLSSLKMLGAKKRDGLCFLMADAMLMAVFAIPFGMGLGFAMSSPMLSYLNTDICTPLGLPHISMLQGIDAVKYSLIIALISLVAVSLAAIVPALELIKKPLVELAKAKDDINVSLKETWLDRKITYLFGTAGQLASASYQNHKKRYRVFSLSIALSCSLFLLLKLFCAYILQNGGGFRSKDVTERFFGRFDIFSATIFLLSVLGASGLLYVRFMQRKPEFSLLRSLGATKPQLRRMVFVETIYYCVNILATITAVTFIGDAALYINLYIIYTAYGSVRNLSFIFPTAGIPTVVIVVMALLAAMSALMLTVVSRVNVIDELKKNV